MEDNEEIEVYADEDIRSANGDFPGWLKFTYVVLPIWGIIWFALYWNGVHGWLDRGYWNELEVAANTTFPLVNYNDPDEDNTATEE